MEGERLINKLFTDKLGARSLEVGRDCPLDSATPSPSAYPAHASGSPQGSGQMMGSQLASEDNAKFVCQPDDFQ
jgi:hypothetical protein